MPLARSTSDAKNECTCAILSTAHQTLGVTSTCTNDALHIHVLARGAAFQKVAPLSGFCPFSGCGMSAKPWCAFKFACSCFVCSTACAGTCYGNDGTLTLSSSRLFEHQKCSLSARCHTMCLLQDILHVDGALPLARSDVEPAPIPPYVFHIGHKSDRHLTRSSICEQP